MVSFHDLTRSLFEVSAGPSPSVNIELWQFDTDDILLAVKGKSMRKKQYIASEIYDEIGLNLVSCWITSFLMGVLFLGSLASTIIGGIGYDTMLLVLSGLILIQAIRGITKLRRLRDRLQNDPELVRMSDVLSAPSFKGIYAFVR